MTINNIPISGGLRNRSNQQQWCSSTLSSLTLQCFHYALHIKIIYGGMLLWWERVMDFEDFASSRNNYRMSSYSRASRFSLLSINQNNEVNGSVNIRIWKLYFSWQTLFEEVNKSNSTIMKQNDQVITKFCSSKQIHIYVYNEFVLAIERFKTSSFN